MEIDYWRFRSEGWDYGDDGGQLQDMGDMSEEHRCP